MPCVLKFLTPEAARVLLSEAALEASRCHRNRRVRVERRDAWLLKQFCPLPITAQPADGSWLLQQKRMPAERGDKWDT